jgi:hypothetical protein
MKNVTEVSKWFLPLNLDLSTKQIKIQVLNLKKFKTQVSIGYLTLNFILQRHFLIREREREREG